jgi:hypothetical protein
MGPSLRWGDGKGSRRGAEVAERYSPQRHAGAEGVQLVSASIVPHRPKSRDKKWTLNQVQGDGRGDGWGVTVGGR